MSENPEQPFKELEATSFFDILQHLEEHKDILTGLLVVAATTEGTLAAVGASPDRALKLLRFAAEYIAQSYNMPIHGVLLSIVDDDIQNEVAALGAGATPDVAAERLEESTE